MRNIAAEGGREGGGMRARWAALLLAQMPARLRSHGLPRTRPLWAFTCFPPSCPAPLSRLPRPASPPDLPQRPPSSPTHSFDTLLSLLLYIQSATSARGPASLPLYVRRVPRPGFLSPYRLCQMPVAFADHPGQHAPSSVSRSYACAPPSPQTTCLGECFPALDSRRCPSGVPDHPRPVCIFSGPPGLAQPPASARTRRVGPPPRQQAAFMTVPDSSRTGSSRSAMYSEQITVHPSLQIRRHVARFAFARQCDLLRERQRRAAHRRPQLLRELHAERAVQLLFPR